VAVLVQRGVMPLAFVALVASPDPQSGRTLSVKQVTSEPGSPLSEVGPLTGCFGAPQWTINDALALKPSQPE
jgi:hypothetical protein